MSITQEQLDICFIVGACLYALEWVSALFMLPWTYRVGLPVVRRKAAAPMGAPSEVSGTLSEVRLRALGLNRWIFRHAVDLFGLHTPFPIRSSATFVGGQLEVVGRVPLGGVVALASLALGIGGWIGALGAAVFLAVSWVIEEPRFDRDYMVVSRALILE